MNPILHVTEKEHIYKQLFKLKPLLKQDFSTSAVAPFIGRFGYPDIFVGVLSPSQSSEDAYLSDAPRSWAKECYTSHQVVDLRYSLINSRFKSNIYSSERILNIAREAGMAMRPFDVDIHLKREPKMVFSLHNFSAPTGPKGELQDAKITENPKVSSKVEKVVGDDDWKANDAIIYLHKKGFEENFLTRLMSVGNIGIKPDRKLVPTMWSITAVDDMVGKSLISSIRDFQQGGFQAYFGGYMGNYFLILTLPGIWSYELFEITVGQGPLQYSTDHESYLGRRQYADETQGGYYACRLAITERLHQQKRQNSVLALRFITPEYTLPLGVWVVREAARNSLKSTPFEFSDQPSLFAYARSIASKYNINLDDFLKRSVLLNERRVQTDLASFFL